MFREREKFCTKFKSFVLSFNSVLTWNLNSKILENYLFLRDLP